MRTEDTDKHNMFLAQHSAITIRHQLLRANRMLKLLMHLQSL